MQYTANLASTLERRKPKVLFPKAELLLREDVGEDSEGSLAQP